MSLTLIGIIGLSVIAMAALVTMVLKKCLVVTESPNLTVVGDWGKSPTDILNPPWELIFYPVTQVMGVITTEVQRYNMPQCTLSCRMPDPNGGAGIGKINTKEVSLCYHFYFWTSSEIRLHSPGTSLPAGFSKLMQLRKFFQFVGFLADGKVDFPSMEEALKDSLQGAFSQISRTLELEEAINFPQDKLDEIAHALQQEFWTEGLPVKVVSLQRNAPFEPEGELGKSIAARVAALAALPTKVAEAENARRLAVINANTAREVAGIEVETAKLQGDKEVVRIGKVLEAYRLVALPPEEQVRQLMNLEQLQVYREMAASSSAKIMLVPTDVLSGIGRALSAFTGGHP